MRLHHVQVSIPVGEEDVSRRFYVDTLGMTEQPKPEGLARRGGCWFRWTGPAGSSGAVGQGERPAEIHVSGEDPFVPARRAHAGLVLDSVEQLEELARRVEQGGYEVSWADRHTAPGLERFHTFDGHGNRLEVITEV